MTTNVVPMARARQGAPADPRGSEPFSDLMRVLKRGQWTGHAPRAQPINVFATHEATRVAFRSLVSRTRQRAERALLGELEPHSWRLLSAIYARTIGFGKVAELITYEQLRFGLREHYPDGPMKIDQDTPYFSGSGIRSQKNISAAFKVLTARGLIQRLEYRQDHAPHVITSGLPLWLVRYEVLGPLLARHRREDSAEQEARKGELLALFDRATSGFKTTFERPDHPFLSLVDEQNRERVDG